MKNKYGIVALLIVIILLNSFSVSAFTEIEKSSELISYSEYSLKQPGESFSDMVVLCDASNCIDFSNARIHKQDSAPIITISEEGIVEWKFVLQQEGNYCIKFKYRQISGEKTDPVVCVYINDKIPFEEIENFELKRLYADDVNGEWFEEDSMGNDIVPSVVEEVIWQEVFLHDYSGSDSNAYLFHFVAGENKIRLKLNQSSIDFESITLCTEHEIPNYVVPEKVQSSGCGTIKLQAEKSLYRTEKSVIPENDKSSPDTDPIKSLDKASLNFISGEKWNTAGSALTWSLYIKNAGYYKITLKYRQRYKNDLFVSRRLLIDGVQPYKEVGELKFFHSSDWENYTVGNGNEPYLFYLEAGTHTITLEAILGSLGQTISEAEDVLKNLNLIYQDILMIAGNSPDVYRDYNFNVLIPDSITNMGKQAEKLEIISSVLTREAKSHGSNTALLDRIAVQLKEMQVKPRNIASRFSAFKDNIGALGTWLLSVKNQSLDLDYILVSDPDDEIPEAGSSFLKKAWHEIKRFVISFADDYRTISNGYQNVDVWLATGRDQLNTMQKIVNAYFTPAYKTNVNLKLVQAAALLPAISSGAGPDVYIQANYTDAVNYAMRNALVDLNEFDELEKTLKRFDDSAVTPLRYKNGVYALPETQDFLMMFYRTDILSGLGLKIPETWDEVMQVIPVLQNNNMEFAFPISTTALPEQGLSTFYMFLLQNGGKVFEDDLSSSDLSSDIAVASFKQWTNFYVNYNLSQTYDAANRFRTGVTPILIANYTLFNQLQVSAPEIRNLWSFSPVPGTVDSNGNINRSVASTGLCCMILKNSTNKKAAWNFINWWTSDEAQSVYGIEIENVMGSSARYPTANLEALKLLPWSSKNYQKLSEQRKFLVGIPQVPGSYFLPRHLNNAFRSVVISSEEPREVILEYAEIIDREIDKKTKEFANAD